MIVSVRRLRSSDDRSTFRSGQVDLDRFFIQFAGQNQFRHHLGTTYVAIDEDDRVVGFVTVSASQIEVQDLPPSKAKNLPRYPLPALRVARLAIHEGFHGTGVGATLLRATFVLAHQMARDYGCVGVLVDAKTEAVDYYKRFGFFELSTLRGELGDRPAPTILFLELGAIPKPSRQVGTKKAGGAQVTRAKAKSTARPARPAEHQWPKLYEKPPQDLIDFVEARTVYIDVPPLKKRPKK